MLVIIHLLLVLKLGCCTDDHIFETKTAGIGDNVTLTCTRQKSWHNTHLFWIRLVSGTFPEILGQTLSHDYQGVHVTGHITAKQVPNNFVLDIARAQLTDTSVYYCIKVKRLEMTFLKGIFLRIKGPQPDIIAVTQNFSSDPVRPGDSVTLQCSVVSDSENKTCPGDHSVYWFRAGSDKSRPGIIYTDGNYECEKRPDSLKSCVYSFSKNVSFSDAGTYYCAVATCGQILFGDGTKVDIEETSMSSQTGNELIFLLCAALAISLVVITFLVYAIMRKSCDSCSAALCLQTNASTTSGNQQSQQRNEDSLVYSKPEFTRRKSGKAERRNATAKDETIYSDVRTCVTYSAKSGFTN